MLESIEDGLMPAPPQELKKHIVNYGNLFQVNFGPHKFQTDTDKVVYVKLMSLGLEGHPLWVIDNAFKTWLCKGNYWPKVSEINRLCQQETLPLRMLKRKLYWIVSPKTTIRPQSPPLTPKQRQYQRQKINSFLTQHKKRKTNDQ